jgi:hypothetical protein
MSRINNNLLRLRINQLDETDSMNAINTIKNEMRNKNIDPKYYLALQNKLSQLEEHLNDLISESSSSESSYESSYESSEE